MGCAFWYPKKSPNQWPQDGQEGCSKPCHEPGTEHRGCGLHPQATPGAKWEADPVSGYDGASESGLSSSSFLMEATYSMPGVFQFSSVQSCPTLCNLMDCSMPGVPVHHQLPESTQSHVHQVSDAIQPSHPLSSPSPPVFNLCQHQGLFQ